MELATMYYDFINDYSNMFNVKTFIEKEKIRSDEKTNAVIEILNEYYINGTMFCFLKSDKEKAINDIVKKLQSKNGTSDLINKLEVVIDDDENYLVQIILMYDNCNNNIETLKNKVDNDDYVVAFAFYPVNVKDLQLIADLGLKMPPKSTYIEPKPLSGFPIFDLKE